MEIDADFVLAYHAAKARQPQPTACPNAHLIEILDIATVIALRDDTPSSWHLVDLCFEAVLSFPGNTWKRSTLSYRQRQLHFS